jgi:RHH-type proline utilization regulon transcriptional repressor/proline dehydrogenase/delta 1-pyrroline-5-carboxylate dehydrogenase
VFLRLNPGTPSNALHLALLAARTCGSGVSVSLAGQSTGLEALAKAAGVSSLTEDATSAAARLTVCNAELLRTFASAEEPVLRAAHVLGARHIHAPPSASGRLELSRWMKEQSISRTMHRYGNLTPPPHPPSSRRASISRSASPS